MQGAWVPESLQEEKLFPNLHHTRWTASQMRNSFCVNGFHVGGYLLQFHWVVQVRWSLASTLLGQRAQSSMDRGPLP